MSEINIECVVLAYLKKSLFGGTDEEIRWYLSINSSAQLLARIRLLGRGHIRDSGKRRMTSYGTKERVWEAAYL